ncbi:MAG: DUF359 domain-containing protein [Candidatus Thermoplasmatota archaeon]
MYVLPGSLRDKLKEHIGYLVDTEGLLKLLREKKRIVSIGDKVTCTLLSNNIKPMICIVDYQIERKRCQSDMKKLIKGYGKTVYRVKNPKGMITDELWSNIRMAYEREYEQPVRIEVEGEEDLSSLAAIYLAPGDVTIIYGLPNKGVVVVEASIENKKKVEEVLKEMRK